ncbi:PREDICTED: probable receptor-like protein kinase At5g47070 [Nicotiana attenuata]|uniref:non-specific serine/threonine protein kinase n=1 Tax=Nicotiana attenuata TaxID=49451 RepID=A0A314KJK2_NICAT|nr:PREDICTED: probable receptor-like protein kinase At5g47070 [Nicotiana attenuata]OIT29525.1 putative receptor-like protein kinase [Nicotiana attenuata]
MLKCFYIFKDKSRSRRRGESAPELSNESRRDGNSEGKRVAKSTGSVSSARSIPEMYREKEQNLRVFSYSELKEATRSFNRMLKIGEGGFGSVYKGTIQPPNGRGDPIVVAIKKLNTLGLQGHRQWVAEVQFLGVLEHPNLVKLLGYCATDGERGIQRLLVYEYMQNRSLEDHLFNRAVPVIPWRTRLKIILGAAQGMAYLHEGLEVQVIYRDFKSSNVLLDADFNPRLSDFGLAREGPAGDRSHVSTAPVGTLGYAAPEYVETGHLSVKSDIWSFGVVLYEILTGRRTLERNLPVMQQKLLDWVKQFPADSRKFSMIIDPRLRNEFSLVAARRIAKLADSCLNKIAKERPKMSEVVQILTQAVQESEETTSLEVTGPGPSRPTQLASPKQQLKKKTIAETARPMRPIAQA